MTVREERRRSAGSRWVLLGAAVALLLAGAAAWAGLTTAEPPPAVRLEGIGIPVLSPYAATAGADRPGTIPPARTGGATAGNDPALYARAGSAPPCDVPALAAALAAAPDRGRAWSATLGLPDPTGLVPVLLRADLAVDEHGFADGTDVAVPVVLQAGTAVLVDARGEPRVRCTGGSPLTPGAPPQRTGGVDGEPWPFYQPVGVVTVVPADTPLRTLTVLDLVAGDPVQVPTS
ncbi:DUF6777 domain-containing protein [Pseudonocardia xishanensis]|uniref:DUF6777 domain-containing protein n=1 Tax=Pseudonocardia xishanensis TaxID=630995 RepID=A0ABP8RUC5_9PSEU